MSDKNAELQNPAKAQAAEVADDTAATAAAGGSTHLVFHMGGEHYAAAVTEVEEVLEWQKITVVPRTPRYLIGIINIRGTLIPVMDLRKRFGIEDEEPSEASGQSAEDDEDRHILVVRILHGEERIQLGIVVDSVEGVVDLDSSTLEPPPRVGRSIDESVISGVARHGDRILLVVEPERLLPKDQLDADYDALEVARRSG